MADDYEDRVRGALDRFERKLEERWQQTMYDCVRRMEYWTPPPVHFRQNMYHSPDVWDHRSPEVQAHLTYGCDYLRWYEDGAEGSVRSVACEGRIRDRGSPINHEVWWEDGIVLVDEDQIDCRVGELFAHAEDWAYEDRQYLSNLLPVWPGRKLTALKEAHDALVEMAVSFGGALEGPGAGRFQDELSISDEVDELFLNRDEEKGWRVDWTGSAADRVAEGIFASTKPTLINHALFANGLATLINRRAKIIDTYRDNNLALLGAATESLGEKSTETSDHTKKWQSLQGLGTAIAIPPKTAPIGTSLILIGWLGERLAGDSKTVAFKHHPGEVAGDLYDELTTMLDTLRSDESDYQQDVLNFREGINGVPSTFLELYDITENNPQGTP
ncbi:hypothetical protein B1813_10715 [Saccharomonospora piscinae]|uniref:Uncharacterized protein n=1 Tax=Saccharomonospora piscinae TaxID=687388 RepID=A0A1V9A6B1_SACPI|nr:hypothetical protein [Saccharomonospora piscinae]OQO92631.1 hypothetical protein B1813_10715 [Saccharomonospora piscinae]